MQESIIRARLAEAQHTADRDSSAVLMRRQLRYEERDCRRTLINDAAVRARFSCNRRRSLDVVEVDHVALSDDEAAQGYALACQLRPKTDLVVAIAASSGVCKTRAQTYRTRLHSVERLSETAIAFSLERSETFTFLPGQYVNVLVPDTDERRSYSCSSPPGAETLSFLVRNIPPGVMSSYLRDKAVPGTPVEFIGPAGAFYLREIKRPLLLLAGGTGLAPFLSMLGKISETGSEHPIQLVYGVTNDIDLVGIEQLEEFATKIPGFTYVTCVAAADSAHPRKGYVMAHIDSGHLNGGDVDTYLCGPPPMVDAVRAWLSEQSMTPAKFYYEKFLSSGVVTSGS